MNILCKKDWYLDDELIYKAGQYYQISKKEQHRIGNCVTVKTPYIMKSYGKGVLFWSGSDYFDVDELF